MPSLIKGTGCGFTVNENLFRQCVIVIQVYGMCLSVESQPDRGDCPDCKTSLQFNFNTPALERFRVKFKAGNLGATQDYWSDCTFLQKTNALRGQIEGVDKRGNIQDVMPIPFYVQKPTIKRESDISITAKGEKRSLYSRRSRAYEVKTEYMPIYTHEYIHDILSRDTVYLTRVRLEDFLFRTELVVLDKDYEVEYPDGDAPVRLGMGKATLLNTQEIISNEYNR
jgi:hypothetical protein